MIQVLVGKNKFELERQVAKASRSTNPIDVVTLNAPTLAELVAETSAKPILSLMRLVIVTSIKELPKSKKTVKAIENKSEYCRLLFVLENYSSNSNLQAKLKPLAKNCDAPKNNKEYVTKLAKEYKLKKIDFNFLVYWVGEKDYVVMANLFQQAKNLGVSNLTQQTITELSPRRTDLAYHKFTSNVFRASRESVLYVIDDADRSKLLNMWIAGLTKTIQVKNAATGISAVMSPGQVRFYRSLVLRVDVKVLIEQLGAFLKIREMYQRIKSESYLRAALTNQILIFKELL